MERKVYFHDVLKAFTDANLSDVFMAWIDKKEPYSTGDAYYILYRIGWERGMAFLLEDIKSGEFERELRDL